LAFVRTGGQLIHYRLDGPANAPVLAFVNSLGTDHRIWDSVAASLAPRFRLLRYDMRGHGLSDAPPGVYSLDEHVADLAGLLDAAGIGRMVLIGVSVGGLIAQGFALAHPDRLAGLVLLDTAARIGDAELWQARADHVREAGMAAIAGPVLDRWFDARYREQHPDDFAGWRLMLERSPVDGYAGTCATLRDTDLRGSVGNIRLNTLVAAGATDVSTPPELVRGTAALLPKARFALIPGAGHLPNIEAPDALLAVFEDYFREIGLG
jgi:3-oxoadipate enol-lactonase